MPSLCGYCGACLSHPAAMNLLQRVTFALRHDYAIERELGTGAMASVYLARDLKHDRLVALKVLRPELALAVGADRFLREIRTAAKLHHPGILPLFDSGESEGLLYYTMPFVDGESLRHRLKCEHHLPIDEALRLAEEVARALAYAHGQGVIHRDIKPENILIEKGKAHVVDFGIALALEESDAERLTRTGVVIGTPAYMSPEQGAGSTTLDHRSDIYSLACVLFEMLAGEPPFDAPTVQATIVSQMVDPPPRLRKSRPVVPFGIEATVEKALAKNPDDRFQSATEFADALADPTRRPRWRRLSARARRFIAFASVAAVAIVSAGLLASRFPPGGRRAPLRERDWVLVADFDGPRGDATLASAVRELVTAELNQSQFMSTMPRAQLAATIRAAGLPDTTTVNIDLAKELAYRTQVRAVVGGSIDSTRSGYELTIRVKDTDGHELASATGTARGDSIIVAVQKLARDVRERLGERRQDLEANQTLVDIATPSFPAFRRYTDALARKQRGDLTGSTRLVRDAIALDTGFALAWYFLGQNYMEARDVDSARYAFAKALEQPSRLTRSQRYRLLGDAAYTLDHNVDSAIYWYNEYLKLLPRSVGGRNNRGFYLSMLGRYEEALDDFEQSITNNPFGPEQGQPQIVNATDMLMTLGRLDRAQAKSRELIGWYKSIAALRMLTVSGKWTDADTMASHLIPTSSTTPALHVEAVTTEAASLAVRGQVADADRVLAAAAADSAAAGPQRRWYEQARSLLALTTGNHSLGDGSLALPDNSPGALVARGIRYAVRGDTAAARRQRRQIDALPSPVRARLGHGPLVIDALIDGAAGNWRRVVARLADTARLGEHDGADLDHVPSVTMRWIVADAYAHLGQADSAISFMSAAIRNERVPPGHHSLSGFAWGYGTRKIALWQAERGDDGSAQRAWNAFTDVFTRADPILRSLLVKPTLMRHPS